MHSIEPVSFCFHLFLISVAVLLAVAVPTDHTLRGSSVDLCAVGARRTSKLDMKNLENKGHCHYKVCEDKFGYKNGQTRNPDVINSIVCDETKDCKQVYLTVEVAYYTNGSLTRKGDEKVLSGCLYSKTYLGDSITVQNTEPPSVS